jgi:Rieske 2Fe-2S family protein
MYENTRTEMPAGSKTLPALYYTDPDFFRLELERVHLDMWLYAGRTEEIAAPGDYVVREIGPESVIILRDDRGELRSFHNVCRHRGTRLCKQQGGHFPGIIQCPYHAWTYGLDGTLSKAPHMDKVQGFREQDYPLHPVAVDTWDGHLFINLSKKPPPLSEHLLDLPGRFRPWAMEELRRVHRKVYSLNCNWKLIIQNYSECIHCPVIHPLLNKHSHYMSGENSTPRPTYLGGRMDLREGVKTLTMDGQSPWAPLPGLNETQRRQVIYYAILPNMLLNLHPDYMLTFTLWPKACDRTDVICEWYFHSNEMDKPGFDPSSAIEFWDLTNQQDWQVSDQAQLGISSGAYEPGPYSNREELLLALDQFIKKRVEK